MLCLHIFHGIISKVVSRSLGKGDLKHNKFKKNYEKTEKYYTNEGTN